MSNTDWVKFAGMRIIQIIGILILIVLIVVVCVGLFTNKPIKVWFLEFNTKEIRIQHDTVQTIIHDTIPKLVYVEKPSPRNSQKNDNGGSGIQNNAPNQGVQAGRDVNISTEKQLTEEERVQILDFVAKTMKENNLDCIWFTTSQGSNGGKFLSQLRAALIKEGYDLEKGANVISLKPSQGVSFSLSSGKCLNITVGTF